MSEVTLSQTVKSLAETYAATLIAYHVANEDDTVTAEDMLQATKTAYEALQALDAAALAQALSI